MSSQHSQSGKFSIWKGSPYMVTNITANLLRINTFCLDSTQRNLNLISQQNWGSRILAEFSPYSSKAWRNLKHTRRKLCSGGAFFQPVLKDSLLERVWIQHHKIKLNRNERYKIQRFSSVKQLVTRNHGTLTDELFKFGVLEQHVRGPVNFHQCPIQDLFNLKFTLCSSCINILTNCEQPAS